MSKFNLSKDLEKVFKRTFEILKFSNVDEVDIDSIISTIVMTYLIEDYKTEKDDLLLNSYFNSVFQSTKGENDKKEIIEYVNSVMNEKINNNRNKVPTSLIGKEDENSIILSESLDFTLRKLEARHEHQEITTFDFFLAASSVSENESVVMNKLKDYSITTESLTQYKMINKEFPDSLFELFGLGDEENGELKEKTISYDNNEPKKKSKEEIENEDKEFEMAGGNSSQDPIGMNDPNTDIPFLENYSVDLNRQCREGKFDPIVGRESEISQLIEVLSCRKKKNAILTGVGGAGKTSVVIGLVQAIESGNVPRELKGKTIRSVDIMAMVSGSTYRGDFEKKLLSTLTELSNHPEIIAFIDEIHNIVGAGSNSDGKGDAGSIMKPYLSGVAGDITVIGATTSEEYRKFIESDGALKRRFQEVVVEEPNVEQTIEILTKIAPKFEEFHRVRYTPEIIEECVKWSNVYINDRNFPDKAIDVLDMSGSLAKLKKIIDISTIENLEKSIKDVIKEKIDLVDKCEFDEAQKRRDLEKILEEQLKKEKDKVTSELNDSSNWPEVTINEVASIISKISKVPIDKIRQTSFGKLKAMKESMERSVIGQGEAINEVSMALNRQFLGLKNQDRPTSILFCGPTGCGKSYLAKIIARELFGTEKALIRIDCSLYTTETSSQKLLGSDPGYVGYNSKTILHDVKKKPFSVILFDEIEKMNSDVINTLFLPLLDEGEVTLSDGEKINFKNSIVIFSSNLGTKELENKTNLGFGGKLTGEKKRNDDKEIVMKAIQKKLRPELIGRIGSMIFFNSLEIEDLKKIFDLEIRKLEDRLKESGFTIEVSEDAKNFIVSKCDLRYGARNLNKQIVTYVENEISNALIEQSDPDNVGKHIIVDLDKESEKIKISFNSIIIANVVDGKKEKTLA